MIWLFIKIVNAMEYVRNDATDLAEVIRNKGRKRNLAHVHI